VIDIAKGYRLEYNESDDTYYCLKEGQTCKYLLLMLSNRYSVRQDQLSATERH